MNKTVFWAFAALVGCAYGQQCPPKEVMDPCVCRKSCDRCSIEVICSGVDKTSDISRVFENSTFDSFEQVMFENTCILYLPADAIEHRTVRALHVRGGCLRDVFNRPLESQTLKRFYLYSVQIESGIQWALFKPSSLETIAVYNTEVPKLYRSFGDSLPSTMKEILFENTETTFLGRGVFEALTNLNVLWFYNTRIKRLHRDMFPVPSNIKAIFFYKSWIEELPEDMFSQMPELRGVGFGESRIHTIQESVFSKVFHRLNLLDFHGNPLNCSCSVKWMALTNRRPNILSGKCSEPKNLGGRELKTLEEADFRNCRDWDNSISLS